MSVSRPDVSGLSEVTGKPVGRRVVLSMLGLSATGILWGSRAQALLERLVPTDGGGLLSILPVGRFRIYSVTRDLPERSAAAYQLQVSGLVRSPVTLSYADLTSMPPTTLVRDFQCVTGWRVKAVRWTGVKLADVLDRAGVAADAGGCRFISFDGTYTETLTLDQARRGDVIVAYEMEGKPLTRAHGGPVRMYVAPMYGYKSCKWLGEIRLVPAISDDGEGYWEGYGYDVDGWVGASNGRHDRPTSV